MDLKPLNLFACWVILHAFLLSADIFFIKINILFQNSFRNTIAVSNSFKLFAKVITGRQKSLAKKELIMLAMVGLMITRDLETPNGPAYPMCLKLLFKRA